MPLQVSQNYRSGKLQLTEVGMPALQAGGVVIRSCFSVVSPGTEGTKLKEAKLSLFEKARARPDQVKLVMDVVRQQGLRAAYSKVINRLEQLTPLGYSLAGEIVAVADDVDEFSVGDRVAAGGAGYANHAEYNFVPRNLVVALPQQVQLEHAAFTTIGSIAMHAYRQSESSLGEVALVIGLGLVGQLLTQILVAGGVSVVGIDLDSDRCRLAEAAGAVCAAVPGSGQWRPALGPLGADVVFIVAGSDDNTLLELAASNVRDRGKIVVVGKTALGLDYNTFFKKEIEVRFSRSYGPGRFDPAYEVAGTDYPFSYVRWTEKRNMAAFVDLLARRRIDLKPLLSLMRPFEAAMDTYEQLYERQINAVGVLFDYGAKSSTPRATVSTTAVRPVGDKLRIGIIGAGNYAASMLIPHLRQDERVDLAHVVTSTGLNAAGIAKRFGIPTHGTDVAALLSDKSIKAVTIATRHSSHAALVAQALTAGLAVFVEKPLALDAEGLSLIRRAMRPDSRLMVGFNRRFSPALQRMAQLLRGCAPLQMIYRVQAGQLPPDAWQSLASEGGRFVGEAGHFLDTFQFLVNAKSTGIVAARLHPPSATRDHSANVTATVSYADGSVGTLLYTTQGGARLPKEYFEVHGGGISLCLSNFETLTISSGARKVVDEKLDGGKGQKQQMKAFVDALARGGSMPVPFEVISDVTELTIDAVRLSHRQLPDTFDA